MKTVEISEIASHLESNDKPDRPLVLTRNGQPVAVLLPVEEDDLETLMLSVNSQFATIIERSRQSQREEGRIFIEDIPFPSE
ncbi:type II toxin-antitoxin system Phd/YefM family antitoxin [bacterium]|nr:type II toxin-antitoxin system Phd/YefM family antitoxin [bacterium]